MFTRAHHNRPSSPRTRFRKAALATALLAALAGASQTFAVVGGGPDWGMIGNDSKDSRNQPLERTIDPSNVSHLAGSGYARAAEGNGNNRFYAFSLDGK